jgi:mycofactocin glycosyltransferase
VGVLEALTTPLPDGFRLRIADTTSRLAETLLDGGTPRRVVRLEPWALTAYDAFIDGATVEEASKRAGTPAGLLARRLVRLGFAQPEPSGDSAPAATVVIPVHNDGPRLARLLDALQPGLDIVVVDDGSTDGSAALARSRGTHVVRHDRALGPAAARNRGLREATTPVVVFIDSDCVPDEDWTDLLTHFDDPAVALVAPRIRPGNPSGVRSLGAAYDAAHSPYDMGPTPGVIDPRGAITSASSVMLCVRRDAALAIDGFASDLRYGEDTDFIWRLVAAGWSAYYVPEVEAAHDVRTDFVEVLRRDHVYPQPTNELAKRHGITQDGETSAFALVAVGAMLASRRLRRGLALAAVVGSLGVSDTSMNLRGAGVPRPDALRLAARWELRSLRCVVHSATLTWLPVTAVAARRSRPALLTVAAGLSRYGREWQSQRPEIPAPQWGAARFVDDVAHAAGRWRGALKRGRLPALPRVVHPRGRLTSDPAAGWTDLAVFG